MPDYQPASGAKGVRVAGRASVRSCRHGSGLANVIVNLSAGRSWFPPSCEAGYEPLPNAGLSTSLRSQRCSCSRTRKRAVLQAWIWPGQRDRESFGRSIMVPAFLRSRLRAGLRRPGPKRPPLAFSCPVLQVRIRNSRVIFRFYNCKLICGTGY